MSKGAFSLDRLGRMHDRLSGYVERGELPGLVSLVYRKGEVHVEVIGTQSLEGDEPMQRDTIFRIASMTKPIVAVAAMILVEECRVRLDERVDRWLPELSQRQVLRRIDSTLDDTVPAKRPITLRDLLTFQLGFGYIMAPPDVYPIQRAMEEKGFVPGPDLPTKSPDEWMKQFESLPLIHQPGESWAYHIGSDVLGVLISRVTGQSLGAFLQERIFEPLGMKDTGFHVPAEKLDRLPPSYISDSTNGGLKVYDDPRTGQWSKPPVFHSGGGGLVSTVDDYLAFCQMMLGKGRYGRERILSRPSVELMTMDHLTAQQKADFHVFFGGHSSWGFGMAVNIRRYDLWTVPGRFGWDGGFGTSAYTDPQEEMIGILLTQRLMDSPQPPGAFLDFWTTAYQAIEDEKEKGALPR